LFLHDLVVRAAELTVAFEQRQAVWKPRRDVSIDEPAELRFADDAVGPGRPEVQLGARERQRARARAVRKMTLDGTLLSGPRVLQLSRLHRPDGMW
jgi:hypothetical protein